MKKKAQKKKVISIRISPELKTKIVYEANKTNRSLANWITLVLKERLEDE